MTSRLRWLGAVAGALLLLVVATDPVPAATGLRIEETRLLAPGVDYLRMVRSGDSPVTAHAVRLRVDLSHQTQAVLSNDRVGGPEPILERTSDMCQRVRCIAAVNGDFALPGSGQPVGGVAHGGRLLRSPIPTHDQLSVGGSAELTAGPVAWSGQLVPPDLGSVPLDALNRERGGEGVFVYTVDHGASTGTAASGVELVARSLEVQLPLGLGRAGLVELVELRDGQGDSSIPRDGLVFSAEGAGEAALRSLWARAKGGLLRLETSPGVTESIGGSPILMRAGLGLVTDDGTDFTTGRHPRTLVGWNQREAFFVAVDGRQPGYSVGVTLPEAVELLAGLGATDAINLDGGGSTTLAVNGKVVNRPSDRLVRGRDGTQRVVTQPSPSDTVLGSVERPVADALALVPSSALPVVGDVVGALLRSPGSASTTPGVRNDPASRP